MKQFNWKSDFSLEKKATSLFPVWFGHKGKDFFKMLPYFSWFLATKLGFLAILGDFLVQYLIFEHIIQGFYFFARIHIFVCNVAEFHKFRHQKTFFFCPTNASFRTNRKNDKCLQFCHIFLSQKIHVPPFFYGVWHNSSPSFVFKTKLQVFFQNNIPFAKECTFLAQK